MRLLSLSSKFAMTLLIANAIWSCNPEKSPQQASPYRQIEDPQAREILQKAIDRAGGWDRWNDVIRMKFDKYTALYEESGQLESEVRQRHKYTFRPEYRVDISWESDGMEQAIQYEDGEVSRLTGGETFEEVDSTSLMNSVLSATFVISLPFKLLDEGVVLQYDGIDTLHDGQVVRTVKAVYRPSEYNHHSTPDTWWHFFSEDDYRHTGYVVQHADHFSYVKNLSYAEIEGFLFPRDRISSRVDSLQNILYTRARYEYTAYELDIDRR